MTRLILDCDTRNEIDDQFAIVYALGNVLLEGNAVVEGIVNVQNVGASGEDSVRIYQQETECILRAMGMTGIPNLPGAHEPMADHRTPRDSEGIEFIIDRARAETDERLTVVATGPASDVASAILKAPDIAHRVQVIWLGAFRTAADGARTGGSECNFVNDRWAAKALFESAMPLVQIPALGVTEKLVWPTAWVVHTLRAVGTPINRFLADLLETSPHGNTNKEFWDIGAVACALHPEWVTIKRQPAHGVTNEGTWDFAPPGARTIEFVDDLNPDAILDDAMRIYQHLT